jgi:AhpC/TSA antioxidant enzyme
LCRKGARKFRITLADELARRDVSLVGVGVEELGADAFMDGNYWQGLPLYIDSGKHFYKALGCKESGAMSTLFRRSFWSAVSDAKSEGFDGDMKGDGWQRGGVAMVSAEGVLEFAWQQPEIGEHMDPQLLLDRLDELAKK